MAVQYAKTNMDNSDKDAKGWSIAYIHGLSKRTDVYAGYNRINNDDAAKQASITAPVLAGDSSSAFGFGLRHRF